MKKRTGSNCNLKMESSKKIVTEIPLKKLWNDKGIISVRRDRYLTRGDLVELLKATPVEFVIANIGNNLKWIPKNSCYKVWSSSIKKQVVQAINKFELNQFPNGWAYVASEWSGEIQTPIVLLEKYH